jgi:V8-like Glu-specific endopeptidase
MPSVLVAKAIATLFAVSILESLGCPLLVAQSEDQFISSIQATKRSTVAVACVKKTATGGIALASLEGTGFFVSGDGTFITAGHVAHGFSLPVPPRKEICEVPAIYLATDGWKAGTEVGLTMFKIGLCKFDDDLDLAQCKTVDNPFASENVNVKPTFVTFDLSIQKEGTQLAFTGFPISTAQPITARGTVGTYWGTGTESNPREIVIDHNNWPGASGSPVYLANGKVIGLILQRGMNDATGLAFARSAIFIEGFLSKNKIEEAKTPALSKDARH